MEELSLDNILDDNQMDELLFDDGLEEEEVLEDLDDLDNAIKKDKESTPKEKDNKEEKESTEDDNPESVGREEEGNKDTLDFKDEDSSPNLFSSIAQALKEEGIFPDLEEQEVSAVTKAEDFKELIEKQIQQGLDEQQKRIKEALDYNVEVSEIKKYENTINYLENISYNFLDEESEDAEKTRRLLIYQDYINRGFTQERANKEANKSITAGTDVEDAKDALKSNLDFYKSQYQGLVDEAKKEVKEREKEIKKLNDNIKSSVMEDKTFLGSVEVDKTTRTKIFDTITKPVYKDPQTGAYLTALQKYQKENHIEFMKNVGVLFTLTNGFKNIDGLVNLKVNKEMKKGLKDLEHTLNNTMRTADGSLKFMSGVSDDKDSFSSKGFFIDV